MGGTKSPGPGPHPKALAAPRAAQGLVPFLPPSPFTPRFFLENSDWSLKAQRPPHLTDLAAGLAPSRVPIGCPRVPRTVPTPAVYPASRIPIASGNGDWNPHLLIKNSGPVHLSQAPSEPHLCLQAHWATYSPWTSPEDVTAHSGRHSRAHAPWACERLLVAGPLLTAY